MRGDHYAPLTLNGTVGGSDVLSLVQGSGQGPVRQQGKGSGAMQRAKAAANAAQRANAAQPAQRKPGGGAGAAAAAQQLSQEDLKSVASLLTMIRDNAADKDG